MLSCAYFVKKTTILPKTDALMSFYFQFFLENPPAVIPIFGQKPVKTTLCYGQKSQQDVLFSDLRRKNHTSHAHILSKKHVHPQKMRFSHAHILSKKRQFSQKHSIVMSFFQIFIKNPLLLCPYLVKETSILLKLSCSMDQKTWYNPLFPDFWRKTHSSHAYFLSKKCPFSKIHNAFMPIFCEQNIHSLKKTMLSCNFLKFFMKNPHCQAHIWSKKTSTL